MISICLIIYWHELIICRNCRIPGGLSCARLFYKLFAFLSASGSGVSPAWEGAGLGILNHVGIITQTSISGCFDHSQETSPSTWVQDSDKLPHRFSGPWRFSSCLFFPLNSPLMGISIPILHIFKRIQSYIIVGLVSGPSKHPRLSWWLSG